MAVAQERTSKLYGLSLGDLRDACLHIPELHEAVYLSVFHARQACVKLGLTSFPLLNTAAHEAQRLQQEREAAARRPQS